jgi:predicted metal-binding membrane protein
MGRLKTLRRVFVGSEAAPGATARNRTPYLLVAVAAIAWGVTAWTALDMSSDYAQLAMPMDGDWSIANGAAVFAMWSVMMAAMMLPSALPMLMLFNAMAQKGGADATRRLIFFAAGYLCVWTGFSLLAAIGHWVALAAGALEPMSVASTAPLVTAGLLLLAGLVQFSPLKQACLAACRSPLGFIVQEWREGSGGAWRMGLRHGLFCVGCCWALMLLLFAFGAMNLAWVVLLAVLVAVEKMAPRGATIARGMGLAMIAAGVTQLSIAVAQSAFP